MDKIKFLLVGCGRIGTRHAEIIAQNGELLAVCDIVEEKAKILADKYGALSFTEYNEMVEECTSADAVSVCTPNGLHAVQSIGALKKGFHVLCEKPMALHSVDCAAMVKSASDSNRLLFVVKQNRFNPPVVAVKKLLEEGRLGKIYSIHLSCFWNRDNEYYTDSWRGTKELDGGTLFTQFSHFIDLLYWMFGDVSTVQAITKNSAHEGVIEFEDNGVVMLEFCNGIIGSIHYTVNACKKNMEGSITIFGEKGTVKIGGEYLNKLEYQQIEDYVIANLPQGNPSNNYGGYSGSMSNHGEVYQHVIQAIENGNYMISTNSIDALKTVEIIEKIYAAAAISPNKIL